jgi:hypothetical protein
MADEESLSFAEAAHIVSRARNVTFTEAEALLRAAIGRGDLRTEIDQQLAASIKSSGSLRDKRSTVEPSAGLDILRESATQSYLANVLDQNPRVNKADLENWLHQPGSEKLLKFALRSVIEDAITWAYDETDKAGSKPPNINELVKPVQSRLKALGYRPPSGRQIKDVGSDKKFAKRRGEPGKRFT